MNFDINYSENKGGPAGIVMIVVLISVCILVLIFVGILGGSVYSNVEPSIMSVSIESFESDDVFTASFGVPVSLSYDLLTSDNVSVMLNK
jgi:hypothetical protein